MGEHKTRLVYRDRISFEDVRGGAALVLGIVVVAIASHSGMAPRWLPPAALGMAIVYLLVGGDAPLRRQAGEVDVAAGVATAWRMKQVFWRQVWELPLGKVRAVAAVPWREGRQFGYAVKVICGDDLAPTARIFLRACDRLSARRIAEEISLACDLPLVDTTVGTGMVRRADDLRLSYAGRADRDGTAPSLPPPPQAARCLCSTDGRAVRIEIPPAGLRLQDLTRALVIAAACVVVFGLLLRFAFGNATFAGHPKWALLTAAVGLLSLALAGGTMLWQRLRRTSVQAGPEGLRVVAALLAWSRSWSVTPGELEEIQIIRTERVLGPDAQWHEWIRGHALFVQGARQSFAFGHGLRAEELRWIKNVLDGFILGRLIPAAADGAPESRTEHEIVAEAKGPAERLRLLVCRAQVEEGALRPNPPALIAAAVLAAVVVCLMVTT